MPKQEGQKSKLLTLLRILEQKTDEEHLLNVPQLVELLEQQDILAERKSIYSDIDTLRSDCEGCRYRCRCFCARQECPAVPAALPAAVH